MAAFLVVAGLTGSLLAWYEELDAALNPRFHRIRPPAADAVPLDPLVLRQQVAQRYPGAEVLTVWLDLKPDRGQVFYLAGKPDPATGRTEEPTNDEVIVHPYTGEILGARRWGDITQGPGNLMSFVYRLHYPLALDTVGRYLLGIVALLWMIDGFVGACLTLPPRARGAAARRSWLARWRPAWVLRRRAGAYKLTFDLHRAGGLWVWAMLFVLAWSSVSFNLSEVYQPALRWILPTQPDARDLPAGARDVRPPALDWFAARETGRRWMAEQARKHGFTIHREDWMAYDANRRMYRYDVISSLDVNRRSGDTRIHFDADTGALRGVWLPTGAASGDTFTTWITSLHMAALGGWPMQLFVCAMGLLVAMLSVTGVIIWVRKRTARRASERHKHGTTVAAVEHPPRTTDALHLTPLRGAPCAETVRRPNP